MGMRDICFAIDSLQRSGQMFFKAPVWHVGSVATEAASTRAAGELTWLANWLLESKVGEVACDVRVCVRTRTPAPVTCCVLLPRRLFTATLNLPLTDSSHVPEA